MFNNTSDITITLKREINKNISFNKIKLNIFNLTNFKKKKGYILITRFYYFNIFIITKVKLVYNNKLIKAILTGIKKINIFVIRKVNAKPVNTI